MIDRTDPLREAIAKEIFDVMPYDLTVGTKPAWIEGGNSLKQDEARRRADVALAAPQPAAPLGGRDEIAAFLFARDEACISEGVTPDLLQWGRGQISLGKNAVHSGDCTRECHSCARCAYEIAVRDADAILAAIPQERGVEREAELKQILSICEDNALESCNHRMALEFVRQVVSRALAGKETGR